MRKLSGALCAFARSEIFLRHNPNDSHISIHDGKILQALFLHEELRFSPMLVFITEDEVMAHTRSHARRLRIMTLSGRLAVHVPVRDRSDQMLIIRHWKRVGFERPHFVTCILDRFVDIKRLGFFDKKVAQVLLLVTAFGLGICRHKFLAVCWLIFFLLFETRNISIRRFYRTIDAAWAYFQLSMQRSSGTNLKNWRRSSAKSIAELL